MARRSKRARVPGIRTGDVPTPDAPTCSRCLVDKETLERMIRTGNGTPTELRRAIQLLEQTPPLGTTVRMIFHGDKVWACPRHTPTTRTRKRRGKLTRRRVDA